jgi:hypothetical protein
MNWTRIVPSFTKATSLKPEHGGYVQMLMVYEAALFSPMFRRLFTLTAAISLLLCVVTAALWVRSFFTWDELAREDASPLRFNDWYERTRTHPAKYLIDHSSVTVSDSFHGSLWLRWYVDRGPVETNGRRIPRHGWEWTRAAPGRS